MSGAADTHLFYKPMQLPASIMEAKQERSGTMDFAKGFVIFLIVASHFLFLREVSGGTDTDISNPLM